MMETEIRRNGCLAVLLVAILAAMLPADDSLADAQRLLLTGRYGEAEEAFEKLAADEPAAAAIGAARCAVAAGRNEDAERVLDAAAKSQPRDASLKVELAMLAFARGDDDRAGRLVDEAIELDGRQVLARWLVAELHRVQGRMPEAEQGYEWLIDFYNDAETLSAEQTYWIGRAAGEYARWTRNSRQFSFLVNTLYPEATELEPSFWPARLATARLFAEKYNEAEAKSELAAGLTINPNAAELHTASGELSLMNFDLRAAQTSLERALQINPNLLAARRLKADILLADLRASEAIPVLEEARKLNPRDEATLGRLAAAFGAVDGLADPPPDSRFARLIQQAERQNPHCGEFYMTMGDALDRMRLYPFAAWAYREAGRVMPRLMYADGQLGLILMRLGEEQEAAKLLDQSFAADPFNVRVKNMLEVLELLDTYETLETEHFVIRFDGQHDQILAEFAARYLESEAYPEIVASLGYEPQGKSLFEFFNRAKNTPGHSWFSARMVGLPFIGTVGACAGKMVAITSPNDLGQKFDWSRVLKHEFVHVVNLQQTDFNIPHWFTEALAVLHEDLPRPQPWDQVLAQRTKAGTLFDLDSINLGFIRPKGRDDWTLAYCQAELYAQYMLEKFGDDSIPKMLAAYAANCTTPEAIDRCFGIKQVEFEAGYREYVTAIVAQIAIESTEEPPSFSDLQQAVKESPDDADSWAKLAEAYLQRNDAPRARACALAARKRQERHALAGYVLARLYLSIGDAPQALSILQELLDETDPQENVLALMAGLRLKAEDYVEAERLYKIGAERWSNSEMWLKSLSRVYLKSGDTRKLRGCLEELAERDYDDFLLRKKLLSLAVEATDYEAAARWGGEAVRIDVMDAEAHAQLADALVHLGQAGQAIESWDAAARIDPERSEWQVGLAKACIVAGQAARATAVLDQLLQREPDNQDAKQVLESLRTQGD